MKHTATTISIILTLTLCTTSFASKSKYKRKPTDRVRGQYTKGGGYQLRFNNNKNIYITLNGYASSSFSYEPNAEEQGEIANFLSDLRTYLTLRTSKRWAVSAQYWYSPNRFAGRNSEVNGSVFEPYGYSGLYVARAYVTYTPNNHLEFKVGRTSISAARYGSVNESTNVSNGIKGTFNYMNGTTIVQMNYQNNDDRYASSSPKGKTTFLMARQNLEYKLSKSIVLDIGAGVLTGENVNETRFYDYVVEGNLTIGKFFVSDELLYETHSDETPETKESYLKAGYQLSKYFTPNINYHYSQTGDATPTNSFGFTSVSAFDTNKMLELSASLTRKDQENSYSTSMAFYYFF